MKMKILSSHPISSKSWRRESVLDSKEWEGA
jgi:hypothetical protein